MSDTRLSRRSCYCFYYSEQPRPARINPFKVIFHVLVSEDMLDDPKDKVLIMFGRKKLEDWRDYNHVMTYLRYSCLISFLLCALRTGLVYYVTHFCASKIENLEQLVLLFAITMLQPKQLCKKYRNGSAEMLNCM